MRRQRRRGYTLIEVVLVMALIIVLAAIGYPSIDAMYASVKVDGAADSVRAAWSEAQAHAVNESRPYRFAVVPGKGNYRVAPDSAEFWSGGTPPNSGTEDPAIVVEGALSKGIVFPNPDGSVSPASDDSVLPNDGVGPGQWVTTAVFMPTGTAQDDVDIPLHLEGARPLVVHLRALTGVVTVERGD